MNWIGSIRPGVTAVIATLLVGCSQVGSASAPVSSTAAPTSDSVSTPEAAIPEASARTEVAGGLPLGPHVVTKDIGTGVDVTVTIGAPGWDGEPNGGYLCWVPVQECAGPPDGAGLIAFTTASITPMPIRAGGRPPGRRPPR